MGHNNTGIRIYPEHGAKVEHMGRRFEYPTLPRAMPLQVLQEPPVHLIGRNHILALQPLLVGGQAVGRLELIADKGVAEDEQALLWKPGSHRMDTVEALHKTMEPTDLVVHKSYTSIYGVCSCIGWRRGVHGLPGQGDTVCRIKGKEVMEQGGACSGQSGDDDWPAYFLFRNPRVFLTILLHPQAVGEESDHVMPRGETAHKIQLR